MSIQNFYSGEELRRLSFNSWKLLLTVMALDVLLWLGASIIFRHFGSVPSLYIWGLAMPPAGYVLLTVGAAITYDAAMKLQGRLSKQEGDKLHILARFIPREMLRRTR